jgi:hypothetical protein
MNLTKTDVAGYKMQTRGCIVNTNDAEYLEYKRRRQAFNAKDAEILSLNDRINILEQSMSKILLVLGNK